MARRESPIAFCCRDRGLRCCSRANAVVAPDSESPRVLATLQSIDPSWHRVLEAGGLVLMLPEGAVPESSR